MGRSFTKVTPDVKARLPLVADVESSTPGHFYRLYWDKNTLYQTESIQDENGTRVQGKAFAAEYLVGSGANGFSFIFRRGNRFFEAPLSYYSATGNWDLSPGFETYDAGFARPVRTACLECHVGRFAPGVQGENFPVNPFTEEPIACESCHGPGELHVRQRGAGKIATLPDNSIVNPARLTQGLANDVCVRCHQGNDARVAQPNRSFSDFRPGTKLLDTLAIFKLKFPRNQPASQQDLLEHGYAMTLSKCFRVSGSLTCLSCHSIHRSITPAQAASFYRAKCMNCHAEADCKLNLSRRGPDDCASCHMPKRPIGLVAHSALTNHLILRTPDEPLPDLAFSQSGVDPLQLLSFSQSARPDLRSIDRVLLLQAYQSLLAKAPRLGEPYRTLLADLQSAQPDNPAVAAAAGHELVTSGSLEDAERAIPLLRKALDAGNSGLEVSLDLSDALVKRKRYREAAVVLRSAVRKEPYDPKLLKAMIEVHLQSGEFPQAFVALKEYVEAFPADLKMKSLLDELQNLQSDH